jgi:hypothetical protein
VGRTYDDSDDADSSVSNDDEVSSSPLEDEEAVEVPDGSTLEDKAVELPDGSQLLSVSADVTSPASFVFSHSLVHLANAQKDTAKRRKLPADSRIRGAK